MFYKFEKNESISLKTLRLFSLFIVFLTCSIAIASEKQTMVTGYGISVDQAIAKGLTQAISQISGVNVDSKEISRYNTIRTSERTGDKSESNSSLSRSSGGEVKLKTQGLISRYEVLDTKRSGDGMVEVTMRVYVNKYTAPGLSPNNRRKLAVIPIRFENRAYRIGERIDGEKLSQLLTQKIVNSFTQVRRFAILDREYMREYTQEKDLILSPDANIQQQAKLGQVLGADYMVVGTISEADINKSQQKLVTGEIINEYNGLINIDYRIIAMSTRQVKWSDTVTVEIDDDIAYERGWNEFPSSKVTQLLLGELAHQLVNKVTDNIYPIRIISAANGIVVLNQGGSSISTGETLAVYNLGKELRDPYTGEKLGNIESVAARIIVDRVTPKVSYARVIEGDQSQMSKKAVVRRVPQSPVSRKNIVSLESASSARPQTGGVVLPFDR